MFTAVAYPVGGGSIFISVKEAGNIDTVYARSHLRLV